MGVRAEPMPEERAALIARNVAAAPPFSAETLERLAGLLGPAAAQVARERLRIASGSARRLASAAGPDR
jgi:hypothetical protein